MEGRQKQEHGGWGKRGGHAGGIDAQMALVAWRGEWGRGWGREKVRRGV